MTKRNWLEKAGASPAKLALVGVLSLALVAVLRHNGTSKAAPPAPEKTRPSAAPQKDKASRPQPVAESKPGPQEPRKWPPLDLQHVVAHDPFALPMWYLMAQSETASSAGSLARNNQVLEELRKQQSRIVVITDEDRIATIGALSLRVGDTIEGFEVTEITTEEIVLTELQR